MPEETITATHLEDIRTELNSRWERITDPKLKATVLDTVTKAGNDEAALMNILTRLREVQGSL